mgnify:CR=1 FL=1
MQNFTGTAKKRVVNLGDRRGGNEGKSFLEQAKRARQERERAREREKRVIIIQLSIRRIIDLRYTALQISHELALGVRSNNAGRWSAEAAFVIRFGSAQLLESVYPFIYTVIDRLDLKLSFDDVCILAKALNAGITRGLSIRMAISCLLRLFSIYPLPYSDTRVFKGMIDNLMTNPGQELIAETIQLIFKINTADSPLAFIRFLARAPRGTFTESEELSHVVLSVFAQEETLSAIQSLSGKELVSLLLSVLSIKSSSFTFNDFVTHAKIVSSLEVAVAMEGQSETILADSVILCQHEFEALLVLHSSPYVRQVFSLLAQSEYELCASMMYHLLYIFPSMRTSTCMIMSITPGLPSWIHQHISRSSIYEEYICELESLADVHPLKDKLLSENHRALFDKLVFTYNHVLSSWLVVSKDTESFQNQNFPLKDVKSYCHFLKMLCLSLIRGMGAVKLQTKELKDISISVLNQLYMKNLRLQFLPKQMWEVERLNLVLDDLILETDQEEEDFISEDEDGDRNKGRASRTDRIPPSSRQSLEKDILNKLPFFINFTTRVKIFQNSIKRDKFKYGLDSNAFYFSDDINQHKLSADIRREAVLDDAFDNFFRLGDSFKNQLKVTFHNEHGPEAGIDGGGLTKEFLTSVVSEGLNPENALSLFKESSSYNLYPNDDIFWKTINNIDSNMQRKRLMYINFLGMIIGKCLYEGILIDASFAPSFLFKWRTAQTNLKNSIDDLVFLDPELYTNLNKLLAMGEDELRSLELNFTIDEVIDNKAFLFDLSPPHGAKESVTVSNRLSYIHKVSHFKLNQSLQLQTRHFLEGLFRLIRPSWLNMFDPLELQMLISGGHDIDLKDWRDNVQYGGYFDDDETILKFWEVVNEMTSKERCDLIRFVTSVSRAPLLGFGVMYPKFGISNGGSLERLPTASTCLNLLKLPDYKDKELIREKLLYSIYANSGFDLS